MTREPVALISLDAILSEYPLHGQVQGWFFRQREISNGAWLVEGSDRWGRLLSRTGGDPESLLAKLVDEAEEINRAVSNAP